MTADRSPTALAVVVAAFVQTAILAWMVWERVDLLRSGRPIVLNVVPVDPRDMFRGDYIVLTYAASMLRTDQVEGDRDFKRNDRIYVGLRENDGGPWQAFSMHHDRPPITGQVVFLRGRVADVTTTADCTGDCRVIRVRYGIESYFVPEGEGRTLEALRNDSRIQIMARVTPDGDAAIAGLMVDSTLRYTEPLF